MKKTMTFLVTILMISILAMSVAGCTNIDPKEGVVTLRDAYANTRDNYNDIYYYQEKIYKKATEEKDGTIIHRSVNVNCKVNNKYELEKDVDYAINLYEDRYIEKMDATSKLTNNMVAFNNMIVGETTRENSKDKIDVLYTSSGDGKNSKDYTQEGVKASDVYASEYFREYQLMNTRVMQELGAVISHDEYMDFDAIEKGGIVKKGKTTDYTFKVTDAYLDSYKTNNGVASIFDGKYVWVQTIYDRVANIYVYREENLGGSMALDYECYTFTITYVGPKVHLAKFPATDNIESIFDGEHMREGIFVEI